MDNKLHWKFYINERPPQDIVAKWNDISEHNASSCASSFPDFALSSSLLLDKYKLVYAFAFVDQDLVLAVPLFIKVKRICFLKVSVIQVSNHDHLDVFVFAGQNNFNINDLVGELKMSLSKNISGWDYFQARNIIADSGLHKSHMVPFYHKESAYFDIESKATVSDVISKKMFKNINRLEKKMLAKDDALDLKCYTSENEVADAMSQFIELEGSGWKGKLQTSISSDLCTTNFYKKSWKGFSKHKKALIYLLYLNDKLIAGAISFRHCSNLYLHKISYSEDLTQFGPGSILVKKIIECALLDTSITTINLNTSPKWAERWHPEIINLRAIEHFNYSVRGLILKLVFSVYRSMKFIKRKLFRGISNDHA
ncbi:MAG: GNAT family N-acetyltransferase [Gammaproteobacteria bacterium]|nr:GNAT family N-acetyltransferase [Gammaproteobacteria bacterium]